MAGASTVKATAFEEPWNGTVVRSRFFDAISLLLPAAEAFTSETIAQWLQEAGPELTPRMRAEAERFIGEEGTHQKVHGRYNAALASKTPAAAELADWAARAVGSLRTLDLPTRVALVAAFEHLTAVLSLELLQHSYLLSTRQTPQRRIWRWHAAEEVAHSHVAFAASASLRMAGWKRCGLFIAATGLLGRDIFFLWRWLCRCDVAAGIIGRWRVRSEFCHFFLRGLPALARMSVSWARYLLPGSALTAPKVLHAFK